MKRLLVASSLLLSLFSCEKTRLYGYDEVAFPETVTNMGDINSVNDDYNSNLQTVGELASLTFSSKRGGRSDFDFVNESLNYYFDLRTGQFSLKNESPSGWSDVALEQAPIGWAATKANSPANELGPYIRSYDRDLIKDGFTRHYGEYLMLFASDRGGNLDIYLTHNYRDNLTGESTNPGSIGVLANKKPFAEPVPVPFLNSAADDAYPTFDRTYRSIYFTSNREGTFDIFRGTLPALVPTDLHKLPALSEIAIEREASLSSSSDDKCPFIRDNMLVFTSNRPGGYGGYDLYYSLWDGSRWAAPVNFGPAINTASDEYRPILTGMEQYTNQLMIFSSNRPGGKGGFDLYRVGVMKVK